MAEHTGLLVIDMQNSFCDPRGVVVGLGMGLAGIEPVVQRNADAVALARRQGLPVVFTRHCYRPGYADASRLGRPAERSVEEAGGLQAGSWDADVVEILGRRPEDPVVDKCRNDAFYGTSLEPVLRNLGVDRLLVTGVVTNVCVESTVRSAYMRDVDCTVLGDCCASLTEDDHRFSLACMERYGFASVTTLDAALEAADGTTMAR